MRCLILQHLDHDGPGLLELPLRARGWEVEIRRLEPGFAPARRSTAAHQPAAWAEMSGEEDRFAGLDDGSFELAMILGGQFAAYDLDRVDFLGEELRRLGTRLGAGRPTLGICLGAQLMAAALGARVTPAAAPEIGWRTLVLTPDGSADPIFAALAPPGAHTLQWHNDAFAVPESAVPLARAPCAPNQAFRCGRHSYALQFHPEVPVADLPIWIEHSDPPLTGPPRTPTGEEILHGGEVHGRMYEECANRFMIGYLSSLESAT